MLTPEKIHLQEDRFARLQAIEWWNQEILSGCKILVVGVGALGNEVIKNLALLGLGRLAVVDMDRIELSNLSRSVLFRESDQGLFKADVAAERAKEIYPGMQTISLVGDILSDIGLGWFRWADVIIGALDNREARLRVNSACAHVNRPWIDGAIEILQGVARGFHPPKTPCYECTMGAVDRKLLDSHRSCGMLARRARQRRGEPTTPTTASIIGAIQAQEAVKLLHGLPALLGSGFFFEGLEHASSIIKYQISPDCPWHEAPAFIEECLEMNSRTPLHQLLSQAEKCLGTCDALEFSRELLESLHCAKCGKTQDIYGPAEKFHAENLPCPQCGTERSGRLFHTLTSSSPLLARTPAELGLPPWDIIWARRGDERIGLELRSDQPVSAHQTIAYVQV